MTNITQRKNKLLLRLTLAMVLFAQGVIAVHACVLPSMNAAQAFAEHDVAKQPCHGVAGSPSAHKPLEKMNNNACLASCTQSDQVNVDQPNVAVAPVSATHFLPASLLGQRSTSVFIPLYQVFNTGPPVFIRFCTFLI